MFKHILIAFDGTPGSEQALKQGIALAGLTGASLAALSVEEKLPAYAASVGEVEEAKREMDMYFARVQAVALERARAAGVTLNTAVRAGHAAETIIRFADEGGFDLIVIGADGRRGLGGTADRVAERAPCSVLIARASPLSMHVKDVMSTEVVTVSPTAPLAQVFELLLQRKVKAVPVVDAGRVVGIITGGDLLRRAGMGLRLSLQRQLPPEAMAEQLRQFTTQGKTAADVMTTPAISVSAEARVSEAARLMVDRHIKRLPVVDGQGTLVGIVSRLDVLMVVASIARAGDELPALPAGLPHTAGDVMFREVPTVGPDAPLNEALNKLVATPLRRVVVVDELHRVLGIIVDADLLARFSPRAAPGVFRSLVARLSYAVPEALTVSGRAADVMVRQVFTVRQDAPLAKIVQTMIEKHIKRLVVTDAENRLVGMIDRQSLLHVIGRSFPDV